MRAVRPILALLAALVLLLPSAASAHSEYYCRMMGRIVGAASCTHEASQAPSHTPELEIADCCQRLSKASRSASLGTHSAAPSGPLAALQASRPAFIAAPAAFGEEQTCAESTQAPLAIGPPLFIEYCALLN